MPCIMPEVPYCPACEFGYIASSEDVDDTMCNWICLCTEEDYIEWSNKKEGVCDMPKILPGESCWQWRGVKEKSYD